jgi:two-component system sensor histidine kinase BaeS
MGQMMGQMLGNGRGGVNAPVVVDGVAVGSIRLGFGSPTTGTAQTIAWRWILIAALAALVIAVLMALYVSRRISDPLVRLTGLTRAFAAGDRTARASAEDTAAPGELGELARAFDATADDVARSEAARRRMAADIAHELRTPLAALQAGLEEVRDGLVPADPDRIAALHAQSVRLGRVIADLSSLSAAQTATLTLRRELVDLGDLVEDAVSAARPAFVAADVALDAQATHGVVVSADADRVHQAIGNLLTNAVHYCRAGDLVTLTVTAEGHFGVVTVADTGPGIPLGDQPHVFDRLWRGTADTQTAGSGIGLAVVRELVAAHGGRVSVESDGVSGATFEVRLPIAVGSATPGVR